VDFVYNIHFSDNINVCFTFLPGAKKCCFVLIFKREFQNLFYPQIDGPGNALGEQGIGGHAAQG
jgi:hypothetical protein